MAEDEQMVAEGAGAEQTSESREALVKKWCSRVRAAKKHFEPAFKQMRQNMQYATHGAPKEWVEADNYVVPILSRHINQAVARLYAKDPTVVWSPKKRLMSSVWDGDARTLQGALQDPMNPQNMAVLKDAAETQNYHDMLKRICETGEIVYNYFVEEQEPNFKIQLKQLVRRTKVNGVGYLMLGFQRELEERPEVTARIEDMTAQLRHIEQLAYQVQEGEIDDSDARMEELRTMLEDLQNQQYAITREGLVFDFPRSTEIIIDPRCRQLRGLVGAGWFAREFHMTSDEIWEVYGVDMKNDFKGYVEKGTGEERQYVEADSRDRSHTEDDDMQACVWEIWSKTTRQKMTVVDGYSDFLEGPAQPPVQIERFWPLFVLTFNDVESEKDIYPPSDVEMLRHVQDEYNRSRQYRREHRKANKPKYMTPKGRLSDEDLAKLQNYESNAVIEVDGLISGENIANVVQTFQPAPIDPALYETNSEMEDVLRTVGAQEANLGGTSGATATETSIAEESRVTSASSNVDDLDEFLSEIARAAGQLMLLELDKGTVQEIAGPGAVWPDVSREQVVKEIQVDIKAGSSGQPNRAQELANLERGMPFLLQMPGLNPNALSEKYAELLELDLDDLIVEGMPSIQALNNMLAKQAQSGPEGEGGPEGAGGSQQPRDGRDAPDQQGDRGGGNAPATDQGNEGPQPAYPGGSSALN